MTDKELHKLDRKQMLQLMLESGREAERCRKQLEKAEEQISRLEKNIEHLKKRLDKKDAQIHELKEALQEGQKEMDIGLEEAGSIAEAALKLNGVFEAAQKAADQYVYNVKRLQDMKLEKSPLWAMWEANSRAQREKKGVQKETHERRQKRDGASDTKSDRVGTSEGTI